MQVSASEMPRQRHRHPRRTWRAPSYKYLLLKAVAAGCFLLCCWIAGPRLWIAYHFRALVYEDVCEHAFCDPSGACSQHVGAIGACGEQGIRYLLEKAQSKWERERAAALVALTDLRVNGAVRHAMGQHESRSKKVQEAAVYTLRAFPSRQSTLALKEYVRSPVPWAFVAAMDCLLRRQPDDIDHLTAVALARDGDFREWALKELLTHVTARSKRLGSETLRALGGIEEANENPSHALLAREILAVPTENSIRR